MTVMALTVPAETAVIIHQSIARMFHYAREPSFERFRQAVVEQLNESIAFDGASWLSFTTGDMPTDGQGAFVYQLPQTFMIGYHDLLLRKLADQWDDGPRLIGFGHLPSQQSILDSSALSQYLQRYGIHHQLVLCVEYEGTQHLLSLYRKCQSQAFDQYECEVSAFLGENVVRAFDLHLQHKLQTNWAYSDSVKAICDLQGRLLAAESGFEDCMIQNMPNWHSSRLIGLVRDNTLPEKLEFGQFKMQITPDDGLYRIEVYPFDESIEKLTPAEIEVAKLLTQGLTPQQVADVKGLSCHTIENQVSSIHSKMGISKNTEIIRSLLESNYNFAF